MMKQRAPLSYIFVCLIWMPENEFFIITRLGAVMNFFKRLFLKVLLLFVSQILDSDIGDIVKKGYLLKKVTLILCTPFT